MESRFWGRSERAGGGEDEQMVMIWGSKLGGDEVWENGSAEDVKVH